MRTRLVFVEGLPGTGKSTLSQWLTDQVNLNGGAADWYYELCAHHPLKQGADRADVADEDLLGYFVKTWLRCGEQLAASGRVSVFDASLYQHTLLEAFSRNIPTRRILECLAEIERHLSSMMPALVYFSPTDARAHMDLTYAQRGPSFTSRVTAWSTKTPYSQHQGYERRSGSLRFWRDYNAICETLFERSGLNKLRLEPRPRDTEGNETQVLKLLRLDRANPRVPPDVDERSFLGDFHCLKTGAKFSIAKQRGHLRVTGLLEPLEQESVLLVSGSDRLTVRGHDVDLRFDFTSSRPPRIQVHSSWHRIDGVILARC